MRTKKIIALLAVVAFIPGCANIHNPLPPEAPEIPDRPEIPDYVELLENCIKNLPASTPYPFAGTKWKFVKSVNTETGESTEFEPMDCEECYTVTFDTDSTANVRRVRLDMKLDLTNLHPDMLMEDIYREGDEYDTVGFYFGILRTGSYTVAGDELKLYHCVNHKICYLLFKRIESL
jgi:hypothetical protein